MVEAARVEEEAARVEEEAKELAKLQRRQQRRCEAAREWRQQSEVQQGAPAQAAGKGCNGLYEPVQVPPVVQASVESTPDVPPTNNVDTHSGGMVNVSWVQQGASVLCAWREEDGGRRSGMLLQ